MIHNDQYQILASRQQSLNTLLWQTPVLSLTAQAFLFTTFSQLPAPTRIGPSVLIIVVAFASLQLMWKHRRFEEDASKRLNEYEKSTRGKDPNGKYDVIHARLEDLEMTTPKDEREGAPPQSSKDNKATKWIKKIRKILLGWFILVRSVLARVLFGWISSYYLWMIVLWIFLFAGGVALNCSLSQAGFFAPVLDWCADK